MPKGEVKKRKNRNLRTLVEEISGKNIFEYKPKTIINLNTNAEACREITKSSCWRPDIYLDLGCIECSLNENCACSIKKMIKRDSPKGRRKK